jgi:ankyrin repeat protein
MSIVSIPMLCAMENNLPINVYDIQDAQGRNDLHVLASNGALAELKRALKTNPNLNLKTNRGNTPLDKAIELRHVRAQKALREKATEYLFDAIDKYSPKSIQKIEDALRAGADINAVKNDGKTPLSRYLSRVNSQDKPNNIDEQTIQLLLDAGASLTIKDARGYTPVQHCYTRSFIDLVLKASSHRQPLDYCLSAAIKNGSLESVQHIIQNNQLFASVKDITLIKRLLKQTRNPVYNRTSEECDERSDQI